MKTATITFHASHNYGSMLQAYALQQTILRLGYENEIINLRTLRQKQLYPAYPMVNPFSSLENLVKYILEWTIYWRERKLCIQKYQIFEQFLQDKLILTPEYVSIDQFVTDRKQYDCYIAG
ncbi:MAG: polysaccharide pyruvyl transferase family protein, partial [Parabacteroides sp.]|nr:polysaccharide pyruvyl transferase family protein [Parabacteroides sp.]